MEKIFSVHFSRTFYFTENPQKRFSDIHRILNIVNPDKKVQKNTGIVNTLLYCV